MGTKLGKILISKEIRLDDIASQRVAVDAYNMLYQFLTTIRQRDGTPLKDSKGNVTSHLSGLFFRTAKLMKKKIRPAFIFDGKSPELKNEEKQRRKDRKIQAKQKYEEAAKEGDIELMKKYAGRTSVLTKEMAEESKELIQAMGLPVIQAPSEGEAQASYMVKKGEFFALVSQDTDGLLFGSPKVIKNLSISGRRKKTKLAYKTISPEIIDLSENLNNLGIDNDQLIVLAILCGTDFNVGGIKGIGPKKGLALIKKHKKNFDQLFLDAGWDFDMPWKKVYDTIKNMPYTDDYELDWKKINREKVYDILVSKHEFSKDRIDKVIDDLHKKQAQTGLGEFL